MMPKLNNSTSEPAAIDATVIPSRRHWQRWALGCAVGFTTMGLSGCTILGGLQQKIQHCDCVDDFMISHRNKVMATRAWFRVKPNYLGHCYLKDFRNGFIAGYMDVANGGAGCTPSVVSSEYWGWRYQSGSGQAAVNAWYEGFPLGAKAAEQDGIGNYNLIRLNGSHQTTTNMTGTASPTPAVAASPQPTPGGLPPGVVLDEGETLVPGGVTVEKSGAGAAKPTRARDNRGVVPSPLEGPIKKPEEIPPPVHTELDRAFEDEQPAEVKVDPFSNDLGSHDQSNQSPETRPNAQEMQFWNEIPGGGSSNRNSSSTASVAVPHAELELVPLDTTPVSTSPKKVPVSVTGGDRTSTVSEPSQAEIDAVIEEIFGKTAGESR